MKERVRKEQRSMGEGKGERKKWGAINNAGRLRASYRRRCRKTHAISWQDVRNENNPSRLRKRMQDNRAVAAHLA
jgi:hypothetical protein